MKVFWSWQSDTPSAIGRTFITKVLTKALKEISQEHALSEADRYEVDHDTKNVPGWVSIAETIFRKVDEATIFVADVTPTIISASGKKSPNPNVLIELGYAIKSLGEESIILIWNDADQPKPEELPFDIRHRRGPISYRLNDTASKDEIKQQTETLIRSLKGPLANALGRALKERDAQLSFPLYPSRDGDPSIWLQQGEKLEGHETFNAQGWRRYDVVESPRSYVRIIPAGWLERKPDSNNVARICGDSWWLSPLFVPTDEGGGLATNSLGIVSIYDCERPVPQTISATQWFENTGEVWSFDASVTEEYAGLRRIDGNQIRRKWMAFVRQTMGFFKKLSEEFQIEMPIRIEVGVSNIMNVCWKDCAPNNGVFFAQPEEGFSNSKHFSRVDVFRSIDEDEVDKFVEDACSQLRKTFGA